MLRLCRVFVALALQWLALLAIPAFAAPTHIAAELIAEGPAAPGGSTTLALHFRPEAGWHGYWRNPGDAGFGMVLKWELPPGVKVGEPRYPVPQPLLVSGLMNHVYERDYAVLVPVTLPAGFDPFARVPIAVEAEWLACTDKVCVPERGRLEAQIEIGRPYAADERFDGWRAALPAPLGSQAQFELAGRTIRLGVPLPASAPLEAPHFFAGADRVVAYAAPQKFSRKGDLLIVELQRPDIAPADPDAIEGVLRLNRRGDGLAFSATPGAVPAGGVAVVTEPAPRTPPMALLLLGALAGGLLLNLMPCVFPILSLKALSLARAGESAVHARREGVAYTAGVVLACLALGGLLLGLRAAGEEIGWAFQLQEPGVVAALLLLAVALTANFLGVFEFAVPGFASEGSRQGAFATGLLAAFVATPCTGPFMAGAMGAALLLPVVPALALFATLGLGIALPFLAVAYLPGLRARLPRPGPWMARFRRWMALPMGLTALALGWLSWRLGGATFAFAATLLAVIMLAALVLAGRRQRVGLSALWPVLAAVAIPLAAAPQLLGLARAPQASAAEGVLAAQPYSAAALAEARAGGKPVFVWMTADWCLTCKVNEKIAIERADVQAAFARAGVIVLRGDWTRRDPEITRYLTAQGAAGVPLYVWYPRKGGAPRQLPQVLGPGSLTELVGG